MKVASPSVVHPLCETGSVSTVFDSMETRINEVGPVTVGQHSAVRQDVRPVLNREPLLRRGRLTSSEQLSLFEEADEAHAPVASVTSWAPLALALVIVPWVLVGWIIWTLT